jgi:hypothetical protein
MLWGAELGHALCSVWQLWEPCVKLRAHAQGGSESISHLLQARAELSPPREFNKYTFNFAGENNPLAQPISSMEDGKLCVVCWGAGWPEQLLQFRPRLLPKRSYSISLCLPLLDLGVDFQGCLALIGDFPESHTNLGQAVCSACGYIVCL